MSRQNTPSKVFLDVVDARFSLNFDDVGGLAALHAAFDLLARRNDKGVIAAGAYPGGILAASHRRLQQRAEVAVRTIDVNRCMVRRRIGLFESRTLHRASGNEERESQPGCRHAGGVHRAFAPLEGGGTLEICSVSLLMSW